MNIFGLTVRKTSKTRRKISDLPRQRIRSGQPPRQLSGRSYDAAAINRHTESHWLYATAADADSLIRQDLPTLRNRARYEIRNNSYAEGIVATLANDLVGVGSDLQFQSGEGEDADNEVEQKFYLWTQKCDIENRMFFGDIQQLTGARQQCESGEALLVLTNAEPKRQWVRTRPEPMLRLRVIEPDRLGTPMGLMPAGYTFGENLRDGIEYDEDGKPAFYYILKKHPGSAYNLSTFGEYDKIPASQVIHLYRQNRPGQSRGVPWVTPSLPLFANLRRFTLATIQNAETAANPSGTIETEPLAEAEEMDIGDEVEIPRNSLLILPAGSKMNQLKPEHPATTYEMFKNEIINEMARCLNMPFNVAAANSSKYNYASGRLDWQVYYRFIKTIRSWLEQHLNNRILFAWLREALLIPGYFKYYKGKNLETTIPQWNWPGSEHVDPWKEARGQELRLKNLTTNLKAEYAAQGKDWEQEIKQRVKEIELCKELGILDDDEAKKVMEDIARAVRAGVPVGVSEARTSLGLPEKPPTGPLLRFNDQDVLQYHIENGVLTINEARAVLGLPKVLWGNKSVRKTGIAPVKIGKENGKEEENEEDIK